MRIKWKGDYWKVKYYGTGYTRYALERDGISVSWLQNDEQYFNSMEEFIKFLREKEKENVINEMEAEIHDLGEKL